MSGEATIVRENGWRRLIRAGALLAAGLVVGASGSWWLLHRGDRGPWPAWPETALHASATDNNGMFAAATNVIDEDVEGLFLLDAATGTLQCVVLSHRTAKFNALFTANVAADLGSGKNASYLLVTGNVNFRGSSFVRPAHSVAYVVDASTGRYAAYGVPWRRELANQGRGQTGRLALLHAGSVRSPDMIIEE